MGFYFYRPQGNIFTPVCHSVDRGVSTWAGALLGRYTPPGQVHTPWAGTHPYLGRYPPGRYTDRVSTQPPGAGTPPSNACWDTVNKRAVRILLECILVLIFFFMAEIPGESENSKEEPVVDSKPELS